MFNKKPSSLALLVNLGTPDAPSTSAVRRYLTEFLHDYRVVDLSRWLWCLLLHGLILPIRCGRLAQKYQKIWRPDGSPLLVYSQHLATQLQHQMPHIHVRLAMRYGQPSIASVLAEFPELTQLTVLPLYPQYSATTTASVFDALSKNLQSREHLPALNFITDYYQHPAWLDAIEARIRNHWDLHGRAELLLLSFHGIPQRFADRGDPYPQHCEHSARLIAERLQLQPSQWQLCYQSRFGREPWLQPYTDKTLQQLAQRGHQSVDIVCPGFAVDCLETLEEIAVDNARIFTQAGGTALHYISALNDTPAHVAALQQVIDCPFKRS